MLCISIQGTTKLCTGQLLSLAFLLSVVYHLFHFCLVGLPPFPFCVSGFLFPSWFHRSTILSSFITLAHAQGVCSHFYFFHFHIDIGCYSEYSSTSSFLILPFNFLTSSLGYMMSASIYLTIRSPALAASGRTFHRLFLYHLIIFCFHW